MNEQLKHCPSLPTTFSHPSSNFRISIPSRKNDSSLEAIQFWSQFSISAKEVNWCSPLTGDLLHPSEQPVIRRSNVWRNTAVKHPI